MDLKVRSLVDPPRSSKPPANTSYMHPFIYIRQQPLQKLVEPWIEDEQLVVEPNQSISTKAFWYFFKDRLIFKPWKLVTSWSQSEQESKQDDDQFKLEEIKYKKVWSLLNNSFIFLKKKQANNNTTIWSIFICESSHLSIIFFLLCFRI